MVMAMANENCSLSARNYGSFSVKVETVSHGINLIGSDTNYARHHRVFYLTKRTSGSFVLGMVFSSAREADRFARWLEQYGRLLSSPNSKLGPMRVTIPRRRFDKTAIPTEGITYGDDVRRLAPRMQIRFVGSRDPVAFNSNLLSKFILPGAEAIRNNPEIPYFYPAGAQLKGDEFGLDYLYDNTEIEPPPPSEEVEPPPGKGPL